MMYYVAFDADAASLGTLTITRSAFSDVVVDLDDITATSVGGTSGATIFFHAVYDSVNINQRVTGQDRDSTIKLTHYARTSYGVALTIALRLGASGAGWSNPNDLTASHNAATGIYTISHTSAIGYAFSLTAGRQLLGFTSLTSGGAATSHVGTAIPTYSISPTLQFVSLDTPNYEPRGIGNHIETDLGTGGGTSRSVAPLYRRFRQEYETKEKTRREFAASTHPYTFQHMREDCRGHNAFMVYDGFASTIEVFSFRTDSTHWESNRHGDGNDLQYWIDFDCVVEGTMGTYSP